MNPLNYIWISLVLTLCTLSVYNLTRDGQLLEWLRNIVHNLLYFILGEKNPKTHKYLMKPFFECPPCMASIWGTIFYWSIFAGGIKEWIVCVLISSILNKIIYGYVE